MPHLQPISILLPQSFLTYSIFFPSRFTYPNQGPIFLYGHCEFLVFLAAKIWRRKENFRLERAESSVPGAASSPLSDSSRDGEGGGGGRVKTNALSMRMIWSKLGLRFGSSTQHDWMMNASSGEMSSERFGLSCCFMS